MSKLLISLAFVLVTLCPPDSISDELIGTVETLEETFLYSDLVIDGVVETIMTLKVPARQFIPNSGAVGPDIPVAVILFKVNRVLAGYTQPDHIKIVATVSKSYHNYFDMAEGDRYILSLHYGGGKESFFYKKYISRMTHERFFIKDSRWFQGRKDRPLAEGELSDLYAFIEEVARERSIENLTRQADLIVGGKVIDVWEENDLTDDGGKPMQMVRLGIESIMKSAIEIDSTVLTIANVGPDESFRSIGLPDMHLGEEWIVFLKYSDETGYYPFAGVNGLFMVEGDTLIRNNYNRLVADISPSQLENRIKEIVAACE